MAVPSYTYTLANATTADADQVMQNFNDILNGVTDGTKDVSVSALTVGGTATFNGAVTLGNATLDDLTFTGSLASSIPIKTTNTYDIGSANLGLAGIYFGTADTDTVRIVAADQAADRTYKLPDAGANSDFVMAEGDQADIGGNKTFTEGMVIDGTVDENQLRVQANATQTSDVFVVEDSSGNNLFAVEGDGDVVIGYGTLNSDIQFQLINQGATWTFLNDRTDGDLEISGGSGQVGIGSTAPTAILHVGGTTATAAAFFTVAHTTSGGLFFNGSYASIATGDSTTDCMIRIRKDGTSGRSINSAGTNNASGNDYAEYMIKENASDVIKKGTVCGVNSDGKLTLVFSRSCSFVIKSTNPSFVGGDTWFSEEGPMPPKINFCEPIRHKNMDNAAYEACVLEYERRKRVYDEKLLFYNELHNEWLQRREKARIPVDRIAFSGVVPINGISGHPGDFVIAVEGENDTIMAQCVSSKGFDMSLFWCLIGRVFSSTGDQLLVSVHM